MERLDGAVFSAPSETQSNIETNEPPKQRFIDRIRDTYSRFMTHGYLSLTQKGEDGFFRERDGSVKHKRVVAAAAAGAIGVGLTAYAAYKGIDTSLVAGQATKEVTKPLAQKAAAVMETHLDGRGETIALAGSLALTGANILLSNIDGAMPAFIGEATDHLDPASSYVNAAEYGVMTSTDDALRIGNYADRLQV